MLKRWLLALGLTGLTSLAAEKLEITLEQAQPCLRLVGPTLGRAILVESTNLTDWSPCYAFLKQRPDERLGLDGSQRCSFFRLVFTNYALPTNFIWIPPGEFVMGSPANELERSADEGPQRTVSIRRGFWLSQYEVTVKEWEELMPSNPSRAPSGSLRPVENMTWEEAVEYCRRRTVRDQTLGLVPPSARYRLPTEAEWEYACRAGTTTRFSFGDDTNNSVAPAYAWGAITSSGQTHPVGEKAPNPWGLYDMHGNVFEWCLDLYGPYPNGIRENFVRNHVYRGGSWYCPPPVLRSACRHPGSEFKAYYLGFRLLLGAEPTTELHPAEVAPLVAQLNWSADATSVEVVATTSTDGAYVRYTTDGSQPYPSSRELAPVVTQPLTVKAVGFRPDLTASETLASIIEQLPSPAIEVAGGLLRITSTVPDAGIEYALDAGSWTPYAGEITVPAHGVVRARVTKPGLLTSPVRELQF